MTTGKTLMLAALSASLMLGAAGTSFAAPRGPGMGKEVTFVRMLKQFDSNKDGQISKDENKAGAEKLFALVDADKDGSVTPGEFRAYRQEKMKTWRAERKATREANKADKSSDETAMMSDDDAPSGDMKKDHGRDHGKNMKHHGRRHGGDMLMRIADKDENGQLSLAEAQAASEKLFTRMDTNKDGVISIDDMPNR